MSGPALRSHHPGLHDGGGDANRSRALQHRRFSTVRIPPLEAHRQQRRRDVACHVPHLGRRLLLRGGRVMRDLLLQRWTTIRFAASAGGVNSFTQDEEWWLHVPGVTDLAFLIDVTDLTLPGS